MFQAENLLQIRDFWISPFAKLVFWLIILTHRKPEVFQIQIWTKILHFCLNYSVYIRFVETGLIYMNIFCQISYKN